MARKRTPESYVLDACRDYLQMKGWTVRRMQAGAMQDKRGIPVRMHDAGTADLQATLRTDVYLNQHRILWVECKAPNGKQSDKQREFELLAKGRGEGYILAFGIDDLIAHDL